MTTISRARLSGDKHLLDPPPTPKIRQKTRGGSNGPPYFGHSGTPFWTVSPLEIAVLGPPKSQNFRAFGAISPCKYPLK